MNETDILKQIEDLKFQLWQRDKEKESLDVLRAIKAEHRALKSPDSETILFLIRRLFIAQNEIERLKKLTSKPPVKSKMVQVA